MTNTILFQITTFFQTLFNYDPNLIVIPNDPKRVMVCFHGMEDDSSITETVHEQKISKHTLIGIDFPDAGKLRGTFDPHESTFGSDNEILPMLFLLKECLKMENIQELSLYGHSAGGGAIINTLDALLSNRFDEQLNKIGVNELIKEEIVALLRKGQIILDTPLKSVSEIIDFRGQSEELVVIGSHYQKNKMEPIEVLKRLKELSMNIVVHFQVPDEVLSNRDDDLYIERIKKCNSKGKTSVIIGENEGHSLPHVSLKSWFTANNM